MLMNCDINTAATAAGGTATSAVSATPSPTSPSRYEQQKRRDWNTFKQYLMQKHRPLPRCGGPDVVEFLRYLDQFGKTKVHSPACPFFGQPNPPAPCPCPLKQAWGSLDSIVGRLRAAFDEDGGRPEANPFGDRAVRGYLKDVRDHQSKARGVSYDKKKTIKNKRKITAAAAGTNPSDHHQLSSAASDSATHFTS